MLENLVAHQKVPAEKPWDAQVIWSIVLPDRAVQNYGPNLLVLEPSGRGADLNYVSELLRRGHPLGQQSGGPVTSCNDVGGLNKYDYSDIGQAHPPHGMHSQQPQPHSQHPRSTLTLARSTVTLSTLRPPSGERLMQGLLLPRMMFWDPRLGSCSAKRPLAM